MSDRVLSFSAMASPTNVTLPEENLCHYITDDQLGRLGEMRKDFVMEICLAAGGIFFGSLVPALAGWDRFSENPGSVTGSDLLSIVLCVSAFVVCVITGYQWYVRHRGHVDLVTEIKNRPKVPVRLVQTEG